MKVLPYWISRADSLEVLKSLPDKSVDSVVTDPPSGVSMMTPFKTSLDDRHLSFDNNLGKTRHNFQTLHTVNMKLKERFREQVGPIFFEVGRVMKPGSYGIFWAFPRSSHWTANLLEEAGLSVIDVITRRLHKRRPKSPLIEGEYSTQLVQESELWILVRKAGEITSKANYDLYGTGYMNVIKEGERLTHLWEEFPSHGRVSKHPTEKPVDLMSQMVNLITPINGLVLDPFMGSGSTGVAAITEGYRFLGIEQDSDYFNMASERMTQAYERLTWLKSFQ